MNTKPLAVRFAAAAALLMPLAPAAQAQGLQGLYFGVGGGWTHYSIDYTTQVDEAYASSQFRQVLYADFGRNNLGGFKAWVGWQFIPQLAAEIAYVNLGAPTANYAIGVKNNSGQATWTRNANYELQGVNFSLVGTLPISEAFSAHAMVGAYYSQYKYSETGTEFNGDSYSFTAPDLWQTNLSYGAGANWNLDRNWTLRADWDRFQKIGNPFALNETGNGKFENIDLFTFNLVYRF